MATIVNVTSSPTFACLALAVLETIARSAVGTGCAAIAVASASPTVATTTRTARPEMVVGRRRMTCHSLMFLPPCLP